MKITQTNGSATIGAVEYSLPSASTTRVAQLDDCLLSPLVDLSAMAAGDQYRFRVYEKINGGAERVVYESTLTGAQPGPWVPPPLNVGEGWDVTAIKLAGVDRLLGWSLRKQLEGEAVVFADGGITAAKFAANALTAAALAADAVIEIQAGLALSTQVDALEGGMVTALADLDDIQARLPAALVGGRMDSSVGAMAANVITAAATAADAGTKLAAAVWAFAHETGRTAKGVLVRIDAALTGKATGLIGATAAFFRADGITKAVEATQDTALGTRSTASTVAGD